MTTLPKLYYGLLIVLLLSVTIGYTQPLLLPDTAQPNNSSKGLFESNDLLAIRIFGNITELTSDREEKSAYHALTFSYSTDKKEVTMPVRIKTRGHFRKDKSNCTWPPLLINFGKKDITAGSLFQGQDKLKLVVPCRGDEYVIREWLLYRLYNVLTPKSFRARLVKVQLDDVPKKKQYSLYGILLEDENKVAKRNQSIVVERKLLNPLRTEPNAYLVMAMFQYMIANTDWSIQYQQNIKLLAKDSLGIPTTVPFDFDHSGLANAPYAKPAEELEMTSITERRYRGYCISDMTTYDATIALFNRLKKEFYEIYTSCPYITEKYMKTATRYLDEFYETINNPKAFKQAFSYPCDKNGTGNVIIKGLKK